MIINSPIITINVHTTYTLCIAHPRLPLCHQPMTILLIALIFLAIIIAYMSASNPTHPLLPEGEPASQAEFQKNYPKNIFIPLIEYLSELGYRQAYQQCVGCRSEFEGKNVVSLGSMHLLITQGWFLRNINKEAAVAHIANKIFLNSKIKKKLFHVLIAHTILAQSGLELPQFKRKISRQANAIARRPLPHDELFSYPNAVIYLLHLFLKILAQHAGKKGQLKLEEQLEKLSLEEAPGAEAKARPAGSKEEYKFYVKEIVHVLNGKGLQTHSLTDILEQTRQQILERDKNIREKYQLTQGIPNWSCFIESVAVRCFDYKRKDLKITNFLFNQWINQCKNRMLSPFPTDPRQPQKENCWETQTVQWKPKQLNWQDINPHPATGETAGDKEPAGEGTAKTPTSSTKQPLSSSGKPKQFTPIILSKMGQS